MAQPKNSSNNSLSKELAQSIMETMPGLLFVLDADLLIQNINHATERTLGYARDELINQHIELVFKHIDKLKQKPLSGIDTHLIAKDETQIPVLFSSTIKKSDAAGIDYIVCVAKDISPLRKAEDDLHFIAHHDTLTDLPNRYCFEKELDRAVHRSVRQKRQFSLMLIDIKNFKGVNDYLGHAFGDSLLKNFSERLKASLRGGDFVARIAADEFAVISEIANPHIAGKLAKSVADCAEHPYTFEDNETHIKLNIGLAVFPVAGRAPHELMQNADIALSRAKKKPETEYQFFTDELSEEHKFQLKVENDIRKAMKEKQFFLMYQPLVSLDDLSLIGFEVLLRWEHPELGLIPPNDFIPVIEKMAEIKELGEWIMKTAFEQLAKWQSQGYSFSKLAINVSPHQLTQGGFVDAAKRILKEVNISANQIELELTETAVMESLIDYEGILNELHETGFLLSIDDFGTGYSSLKRIKELPLDTLKVDRSFIQDVLISSKDEAIVKSTIGLANNLGLSVVAEGIETKGQWEYLKKQQCGMGQGFYFSKPLKVLDATNLLEKGGKIKPAG